MRKLVLILVLLFAGQLQASAQENSTPTPTNSTQTVTISASTFEKAKLAFEEVKVSRPLIESQRAHIVELEAAIKLRDERAVMAKELDELRLKQLAAKDEVIAAKDIALAVRQSQVENLTTRVTTLEGKVTAANKRTVRFGVAGVVGGFLLKALLF